VDLLSANFINLERIVLDIDLVIAKESLFKELFSSWVAIARGTGMIYVATRAARDPRDIRYFRSMNEQRS
jgi:hypothetical protein